MNTTIKITGLGIIILSAVYAFSAMNSVEPPKQGQATLTQAAAIKPSNELAKKANVTAEPRSAKQTNERSLQQENTAPPSIDKPNNENLQAKADPRKSNRLAPPPPLASGDTADHRHKQNRGHGHEHQPSTSNNNQPAPPKGADL